MLKMKTRSSAWFTILLVLLFGNSCDGGTVEKAEVLTISQTEELVTNGQVLFLQYCSHCHGVEGDGEGFNAEFLEKEPAELSDLKFLKKKTNEQLFRVIDLGGAALRKSHLMPVFGHTLSEYEMWSLVAFIRKLAHDEDHPLILPKKLNQERPKAPSMTLENIKTFSSWMAEEGGKADNISAGEKLFMKKKSCIACHQIEGEGGKVGPDLSRAGFDYSPEWVVSWMSNPQEFKPDIKMPTLGLSLEDAGVIAAYLNTLHTDEDSVKWKSYMDLQGNPENGKKIFFDPEGKVNCSKCHHVGKEGGNVGPDLSFIGTSRKTEFLLESILDPKAVITSGYATILILTKNRKFITGIKKYEDSSSIEIVNKEGKRLKINKDDIKKFKVQKISTMPANFKDLLEVQEVADILAYLKTLTWPEISGTHDH
jgi:putative heme-binding domain-containing protein